MSAVVDYCKIAEYSSCFHLKVAGILEDFIVYSLMVLTNLN